MVNDGFVTESSIVTDLWSASGKEEEEEKDSESRRRRMGTTCVGELRDRLCMSVKVCLEVTYVCFSISRGFYHPLLIMKDDRMAMMGAREGKGAGT